MPECIYKFVEKTQPENLKKKRYRSKYDPKAPLIGSTFGLHGTNVTDGRGVLELKKTHVVTSSFGVTPEAPNPKQFLRKGSNRTSGGGPFQPSHRRGSTYDSISPEEVVHKPPVPKRDEKPAIGLKTCKNFVTENAMEVINSVAKKPVEDGDLFMEKEEYG